MTAGNIVPDAGGNGYYPVYSDKKRGNAGYCAWHSAGTCNGTPLQFAFFFNLDGDAGCDPADTQTGHSQGLAALANVTAHELSEALTDPANPGAWYDSSGAENGDKCAWTFNVPSVTFPNGTQWKHAGRVVERGLHGRHGLPEQQRPAGLPRRALSPGFFRFMTPAGLAPAGVFVSRPSSAAARRAPRRLPARAAAFANARNEAAPSAATAATQPIRSGRLQIIR